MKFVKTIALAAALALPAAAAHADTRSIYDVAKESGKFSTLLKAAEAAGLAEELKEADAAITLLAPSDEAFARLPAGKVDSLLKPENRQQLVDLLKNHIIDNRVSADNLRTSSAVTSMLGKKIELSTADSGMKIGGAKIVTKDMAAANGVIHVIDGVLLPQS